MSTDIVRVGVREFREELARYLEGSAPVAITRHGQTVGIFLPVRQSISEQDLAAFREAADQLQKLMADRGISEDEVVREFRAWRQRR
jgi:hypothetical protein